MPPRITPADEALMAAYQEAALRIQRTIADLTPANGKVILRRVNSILSELDALSAEYVAANVPIHYKAGSEDAIRQLRKLLPDAEIDETFGVLHTQAVQALANDAAQSFDAALEGARQSTQGLISYVQRKKAVNELLASEVAGSPDPQERVKQILQDEGIVALKGKGRKWTLEDYSAMLTRTVLAEAHNTGAAARYSANGVNFVRVIERPDAPDRTCQWMRDKVVAIADRRLFNPYHPNCMGGIAPVLGEPVEPILSADDERIPTDVRLELLKRG